MKRDVEVSSPRLKFEPTSQVQEPEVVVSDEPPAWVFEAANPQDVAWSAILPQGATGAPGPRR
jgi:hypothetical protein